MYKFIPQYEPQIKSKYIDAVVKQMKSGWIGTSVITDQFENKICEIAKVKYAVSTTSGTMALFLGIASLDIPKHKTIVFPAYTFLAGANVLKFLGYKIQFVDIKKETMCINPDLIDFEHVGAVIFVNHNGYCGDDRTTVKLLCDLHNIPMIEDSAQAIGIPTAGTMGAFGIYSFSVPKLVTTGQGGVVITNNADIALKCRQLRDHGDNWRSDKLHKFVGLNLKFNDIAASIGMEQLNNLDNLLKQRKKISDQYRKHIDIIDYGYDSAWMVIYSTNNVDKIIEKLKSENVQAVRYYRSITTNPSFFEDTKYVEAEYIYNNYVYLPSSLTLKKKDIDRICKIIEDIEYE